MTTWTHGLLAYAVFRPFKHVNAKMAAWWAMFPDVVWLIPLGIYILFNFSKTPRGITHAAPFITDLYGVSHSFIVSFAVIGIVYLVKKKFPYEMLAWPFFHILMDIPGHEHFQTPFLYPLSDFKVQGLFNWWSPFWFSMQHIVPLAIIVITIHYQKRKSRSSTNTDIKSK